MSIPDLTVGGVVVQFKVGSVTACSYINCCVVIRRSSSDEVEDVVKLEVLRDGKVSGLRENVEISLNTPYLFDLLKGSPILRPYSRLEKMMSQRRKDSLIRNTLNSYYNILAYQYGPEITSIALLWQGVDFVQMYNKAEPLCIYHIQKISDGMKCISTVKKTIEFMLINFRERLKKLSIGTEGVKTLQERRDCVLKIEGKDAEARTKMISKRTLGVSSDYKRSVKEWRVIHDDKIDNKLFDVAESKGLGKKGTMLKITRTLNGLRDTRLRAKPLSQLCSAKAVDHLSVSKGEQFIRFALHLRNVYCAIARDEGRPIPDDGEAEPPDDKEKVVAKFSKLDVQVHFSDSPLAFDKKDDELDNFIGNPIVSLDGLVDEEKKKAEEEESEESSIDAHTKEVKQIAINPIQKSIPVLVDVESSDE